MASTDWKRALTVCRGRRLVQPRPAGRRAAEKLTVTDDCSSCDAITPLPVVARSLILHAIAPRDIANSSAAPAAAAAHSLMEMYGRAQAGRAIVLQASLNTLRSNLQPATERCRHIPNAEQVYTDLYASLNNLFPFILS